MDVRPRFSGKVSIRRGRGDGTDGVFEADVGFRPEKPRYRRGVAETSVVEHVLDIEHIYHQQIIIITIVSEHHPSLRGGYMRTL